MQQSMLQKAVLATAATLCLAGSALAAPVDTYGDIGAPAAYFGSGNVDGNWTISTDNNVQVALRAKNRSTLQTIDGSDGIYNIGQGLVGGNKALWNYEFSVNLRADGTGDLDFSKVSATMMVDTDPGVGFTWVSLDIESNWPDTAWWDGSAPRINRAAPIAGEFGAQQSANPMFGDSGFNFNPGPGLYGLALVVKDNAGAILADVQTAVQVPEPSSISLMGLALVGAVSIARRRRKAA